jgi:hypothetical protein
LVFLQDALELVVLALLGEVGVDEQKNVESKSFDELIGEIKKAGLPVPRSGTIKALNKQRVITKHYGQLAEPATVKNYYEAAHLFIDAALRHVVGKALNEIMLTDMLPEGEAKTYLIRSIQLKDEGKYLESLIELRKAIYVEIEHEYAIHDWAEVEPNSGALGLFGLRATGLKAPYWTKNKQWIASNVSKPTDYVQVDLERLRLDALEWGVSTAELENIRRLTPGVFRFNVYSNWAVDYELSLPPNEATLENCSELIDSAILVLTKKKEHERGRRWPGREQPYQPPQIYIGHSLFRTASRDSEVVHIVQNGYLYTMQRIVSGFDANETFYHVLASQPPDQEHPYGKDHVSGYLLKVE